MRFISRYGGIEYNAFMFINEKDFKKILDIYGIRLSHVTLYGENGNDPIVQLTEIWIGKDKDTIALGEWLLFSDDLSSYDIMPDMALIDRFYSLIPGYKYPDEIINRLPTSYQDQI